MALPANGFLIADRICQHDGLEDMVWEIAPVIQAAGDHRRRSVRER